MCQIIMVEIPLQPSLHAIHTSKFPYISTNIQVQPSNPVKTASSTMESALGQGVSRVSKQCANHFNDNQVILFY